MMNFCAKFHKTGHIFREITTGLASKSTNQPTNKLALTDLLTHQTSWRG